MPNLELKIPPPLVAVMTAGAMYGVASLLPVLALSPSVRAVAALALAVVGASFDVAGLVAFRRAKTTVNPMARACTASPETRCTLDWCFCCWPGRFT